MTLMKHYRFIFFELLIALPLCSMFFVYLYLGFEPQAVYASLFFLSWVLNISYTTFYFKKHVLVSSPVLEFEIADDVIRPDFLLHLKTLPLNVSSILKLGSRIVTRIQRIPQEYGHLLQAEEAYTVSLFSRARMSLQSLAAYGMITLGFAILF